MSDSNMHTTVRVDTVSDTAGIDKMLAKIRELQDAVTKLGITTTKGLTDSINETVRRAQELGAVMSRNERSAMRDLNTRSAFQRRMDSQRESDAKAAAAAERLFSSEALSALREKMQFQGMMARKQQQEARDLAREQLEGVRLVARSEREAARERSSAMKAEIKHIRDLGHERARAYRDISGGAGKVRQGVGRAAVVGAAGAAVVGAGARRGMDKLTKSGITIDESLTQAAIHIFGSQKPVEARKSAEALRKKLMPVATGLGSKTSDILGAYVEASQAGVDSDILDKVVGLGSKYAKMNKLALPKTLEDSGYALQGLKSFGSVNDKTVSQYFNGMSYLVATTAANRAQMTAFGKRGLSAGASVGMNLQDTLAFGGAAVAAGAEGNQAARMLSSQGGRIAGWNMKAHDISRKSRKTDEDRLFLQAPSMMGFGNYDNLAGKFKKDFLGTFADVQSGLKKIADPLKRRSIEKMLFGQEFGSLTDSMVMGGNLREYRNKLKSPEASNFIDQNWAKQTGSFGFIVDQIKSVFQNLSDSLGLALKPIYEDLRDFALKLPEGFDNFEQSFKAGLKGFMGGLGSPDGTMAGLLKQMFGNPADFSLNVKWIEDFSRGFGQGLRTVGDTVKGVLSIFTGGDTSAAAIGKITAEILGFSAALVIAAPVVAVLTGLATAIAGFCMILKGAASLLRGAGLIGGAAAGTGAGAARGAGAAAGAAAGVAGKGKGLLGKLGNAFALYGLADLAQEWGVLAAPDGKKGLGRNVVDFLDPGVGSWIYGPAKASTDGMDKAKAGEGSTPWVDPPKRATTAGAKGQPDAGKPDEAGTAGISPTIALIMSLDHLRVSVDNLARVLVKQVKGAMMGKTSNSDDDLRNLGARLQLAALGKTDLARAAATGTVSKVMSSGGAVGIPYTPGAGGSSLGGNTPGQRFSIPGVGSRFGVGGGTGKPGSNRNADGSFGAEDSSPERKSGGSRSWRNNNPGNVKAGPFATRMGATGRDDRGFAIFPSYEQGRQAQSQLLFGSAGYKGLTIAEAAAKYAPGSDGNDPRGYAADLARATGVGIHTKLSDLSANQRRSLLDAQQAREGWKAGSMAAAPGGRIAGKAGSAGGAVDTMSGFLGANEYRDRGELSRFVGHDVAGNVNAWCARMVNASLASVGIKGTGSAVANSFQRWGVGIQPGDVAKGDVLLESHGRGPGQTGGHVGMATGNKYIDPRTGRLMIERIAGNESDSVKRTWVAADKLMVRRAQEALGGKPATFSGKQGDDPGFTSTGWKKRGADEASDLAKQSPAEKLAAQAPVRPNAGATGAGRSSASIAPVFNIHQAGNPEETANLVQRRIQDSTNYLSHDVSFESV